MQILSARLIIVSTVVILGTMVTDLSAYARHPLIGTEGGPYSIGDTVHAGIIISVDTVKHNTLVVFAQTPNSGYTWNDVSNEIDLHNDSTNQKWRFPTLKELELCYELSDMIPGFRNVIYWTSEVNNTYYDQEERNRRSNDLTVGEGRDATLSDIGSHSEEYVQTVNFYNGVIEWRRKREVHFSTFQAVAPNSQPYNIQSPYNPNLFRG